MWPDVRVAFDWVHRAAAILRNKRGLDAAGARRRYRGLIAAIARHRRAAGRLAEEFAHFLKVTRSYWPGLFGCYEVAGLPRTNNELEQYFGRARHHERRATGHKRPTRAVVVRGSVRVIAAVATRQRPFRAADLCPRDRAKWQELRQELEYRHEARRAQRRFRKDPAAYLTALEEQLLKSGLPA